MPVQLHGKATLTAGRPTWGRKGELLRAELEQHTNNQQTDKMHALLGSSWIRDAGRAGAAAPTGTNLGNSAGFDPLKRQSDPDEFAILALLKDRLRCTRSLLTLTEQWQEATLRVHLLRQPSTLSGTPLDLLPPEALAYVCERLDAVSIGRLACSSRVLRDHVRNQCEPIFHARVASDFIAEPLLARFPTRDGGRRWARFYGHLHVQVHRWLPRLEATASSLLVHIQHTRWGGRATERELVAKWKLLKDVWKQKFAVFSAAKSRREELHLELEQWRADCAAERVQIRLERNGFRDSASRRIFQTERRRAEQVGDT